MHVRRYTFKLYPNCAQEAALAEQARMCAALWNALLQRNEDCYRRTAGQRGVRHGDGKKHLGYFDMCAEITALRRECAEWQAISSTVARGVAQRLHEAFKAFFSRARKGAGAQSGYPRYKRVKDGMSLCFTEKSGAGWRISRLPDRQGAGGWRVRLKGVPGEIVARGVVPVHAREWSTGEILHRDGAWWLSVVVRCERARAHGEDEIAIRFDLIDEFARVERAKGRAPACSKEQITLCLRGDDTGAGDTPQMQGDETLPGDAVTQAIKSALALCERADAIKSERDLRYRRFSWRWRRETTRAARLTAKAARIRKHALHRWTYEIVGGACDIVVTAPKIREATASPRGDRRDWGAHVETVSALNRHALNHAPAFAIQCLRYKAGEAGIRCLVREDEAPALAVAQKLVAAGKAVRKAKRAIGRHTQ